MLVQWNVNILNWCDQVSQCPDDVGVTRDLVEPARYSELAAGQGLAAAQSNYCHYLRRGFGVEHHPVEAARNIQHAADQGLAGLVSSGSSHEAGS